MDPPLLIDWLLIGIGVIGVATCLITIRSFQLREWKAGLYYISGSLVLFTLRKLLRVTGYLDQYLSLNVALEVGIIASIIYGVLRMRRTAKMIGA